MSTCSKSTPSNPYVLIKLETEVTNVVRFSDEPTLDENQREPVHPPMDRLAFTPCTLLSIEEH